MPIFSGQSNPNRFNPVQLNTFKCMKPVIPRANNAIFRTVAGSNNLEFNRTMRDGDRPGNEHGHVSSGAGDSGGPYWKANRNGYPELVAIHHGSTNPPLEPLGYYASDWEDRTYHGGYHYQCSSVGTKITPAILEWVMNKDEEHSIPGILSWG